MCGIDARCMVKLLAIPEKENFALLLKFDNETKKTNKLVVYILKAHKENNVYSFGNKLKYCVRGNSFAVKAKSSKSKIYKDNGYKIEYSHLKAYRFF